MATVTILGAGAMGAALATPAVAAGNRLILLRRLPAHRAGIAHWRGVAFMAHALLP